MSEGRRTTSEVAPHLHRVDGTTAQLPTDRRSRDSTAVPDGEATPPREVPDFLGTDGICLNRVSFRYEPQLEPVLHKITCHIPACPLTCLVGESGSGKSTALGLLTREIQEQQGPVLVDGRALCDFESTAICRQLAVVQQQVMIMDAAMVDNIQLGEADATDAENLHVGHAHRMMTTVKADKVIVISDGRVVESGTPQTLLLTKDACV
eukprot:jgi/Tetstr1/457961/TSEL_044474.t1